MGDNELSDDDDEEDFNRFLPTEFLKKLPGIDQAKLPAIIKLAK